MCPNLGFYEFLKKDYLHQILSWQFPSGCFGEVEEDEGEYSDDVTEEDDLDIASLLEGYHEGGQKLAPNIHDGLVDKMTAEKNKKEFNVDLKGKHSELKYRSDNRSARANRRRLLVEKDMGGM